MTLRRRRTLAAVGIGWLVVLGGATVLSAGPASAELTTDLAECQGTVDIVGDDGTTITINQDTVEFTIDQSGSYSGTGSINGGGKAPEARDFSGGVKIDLPPGLSDYGPGDWAWSGNGRGYSSEGPKAGTYEIPGWVPRGFYVPIVATHTEPSGVVCRFEGKLKITGSFFGSPISVAALAGTLVFGALATTAGMARKGTR